MFSLFIFDHCIDQIMYYFSCLTLAMNISKFSKLVDDIFNTFGNDMKICPITIKEYRRK